MGDLVAFPVERRGGPGPDSVRVRYDFNEWFVEVLWRGQVHRRTKHRSEREARHDAAGCVAQGMSQLPDMMPPADWFGDDGPDGAA